MLIEFSITNFKSIKSRQTFSMAKARGSELEGSNSFSTNSTRHFSLLRSAAIYGANAAGKSNFMEAMAAMKQIVLESANESGRGEEIAVSAFKLDPDTSASPSEFEITFIAQRVRYQYGFAATKERITAEWLIAFPKGKAQHWFERQYKEKSHKYSWQMGSALQGQKVLWQNSTRSNALFLSTAIQLNSEQLQPVYDWFRKTLHITTVDRGWSPGFTAAVCSDHKQKNSVLRFLQAADMNIQDILIEKEPFDKSKLDKDIPDEIKAEIIKKFSGKEMISGVYMTHENSMGESIPFNFKEESQGTKKLFAFAGPWLDSLKKGNVLVVDELHNSLHPAVVRFLVMLFHDNKTNPNNAQLIFTTHETSILSQDIFRRDQIWFCEKGDDKATIVYPLTDFSPRKGRENLEMAYLAGRYGAVPYIKKLKTA